MGKADGIYIRCNGKHILIDSGDVEYSGTVTNYLKRQGVEVLDMVVATHFDRDHIGGMANVLMEFEVKRFLMPELPEELVPDSAAYETMIYALGARRVRRKALISETDFLWEEWRYGCSARRGFTMI